MGCGSSKGGEVVTRPNTYEPYETSSPTKQPTYGQNHHGTTYSNSGYVNTGPRGQTQYYSGVANPPRGLPMATGVQFQQNYDPANLPPPRPPDESLEQLLAGKGDLMQRMDEHAKHVSFNSSTTQNITEFTERSLIPRDHVVETETVEVIEKTNHSPQSRQSPSSSDSDSESDSSRSHVATMNGGPATAAVPVSSVGTAQDNVDAAQLLLDKHKRDTEKAKNQMMVDKMRHDMNLQDKLAKRREAKRKAALAQGTVTTTAGAAAAISDEVSAKQRKTDDELGAEAVGASDVQGQVDVSAHGVDGSADVGGLVLGGEVEAAQDKHDAVMAEAAPMPTAPETRKEAIYGDEDNIELFKDLEDFAVNMEQISSPSTTFAVLMKNLLINQLSDLEKVRILFHWITKQDLNSINFPNNITEDTPMGFLLAIKIGTKTYAELFSRLCSAAGLHAKVITGYLKGVGYLPEYKFIGAGDPFRGSWNAVLINGQWRLIDTHWGARHVVEDDDVPSSEHKTVYRYEEHYFLTNPDQLITTHFPDEIDWQLLREPVTLQQFEIMVKLWPLHYKLKLSTHSHPNGLIMTPQDGVVEIRLKTSEFARRDGGFKCDLMTKAKRKQIGDISLACCVFHYTDGELQVFRVCCPAVGEYILKIFGHSDKFSDEDQYTNIALYQINCTKLKTSKTTPKDPQNVQPSEIYGPFPEAVHPWGPPTGAKSKHLFPMSHVGPIISCDKNGEASLVMQLTSNKRVNFLQHLQVADGRPNSAKQNLVDRAVHLFTTARNGVRVVVFRVRTPQRGNYCLSLYANQESEGTFEGFCNYLVVSCAQSNNSPPFPPVPNGALGESLENCLASKIAPFTAPKYVGKTDGNYLQDYGNGWIGLTNENEGFVTFDHSNPMIIIAALEGQNGVELSRNVLLQDTGRRVLVVIRPPKGKSESPEYTLKLYGGPATQNTGIPAILSSYIIGSLNDPKLFPPAPTKRWGPNPSQANLGVTLVSLVNTAPLYNFDPSKEQTDPSPCRSYNGGQNIAVALSMTQPMVFKPALTLVDQSGNTQVQDEQLCFFSQIGFANATLQIHIPRPGDYNLTIYGSQVGSVDNQLSPLYFMLIRASKASSGPPFPRAFGIWNSGLATLHNPVSKFLKRNIVNNVKVTLANVVQQGVVQPFPSVLLLTDRNAPISPNQSDMATCTYEWDYVPGPGENSLSLAVQRNPQDSSLNYVLQFEVQD